MGKNGSLTIFNVIKNEKQIKKCNFVALKNNIYLDV